MIFGTFLDAKQQLETQRLFQELEVQAHKDYHPSEDFCWFGTSVRSMAASEQIGQVNALVLNAAQLGRELGNANLAAAETPYADKAARWKKFTTNYCDPADNNQNSKNEKTTGLALACPKPPKDSRRINLDIDYTRAIDEPRTLEINFTNGAKKGLTSGAPSTNTTVDPSDDESLTTDEQDIIALSQNLYANTVPSRNVFKANLKDEDPQALYMALRSVVAKRSVARNSFNAIVGLKSAGTQSGLPTLASGTTPAQKAPATNKFLGAILTELGVPAKEVYSIIGNDPSYYAQLELLAKKIYQNPDFYSNLYDKPANILRKSVALKAIELMLDRAIFESQLRQEMATSVLLSSRLSDAPYDDIESKLSTTGATAGKTKTSGAP